MDCPVTTHHYCVRKNKAQELFEASKELVTVFPKDNTYKLLIQQQINQVNLLSGQLAAIRKEMNDLASTLPEYTTVMGMYGIGETYGPQLIAEIGDITRFTHREALTAYAGVDPGANQSGSRDQKSNRASKIGSSKFRKTLFQIMATLLQNKPANDFNLIYFHILAFIHSWICRIYPLITWAGLVMIIYYSACL